jgi:hypothetical protein
VLGLYKTPDGSKKRLKPISRTHQVVSNSDLITRDQTIKSYLISNIRTEIVVLKSSIFLIRIYVTDYLLHHASHLNELASEESH